MISITKKYLTWQRPLWKKSNKVEKHLDIPLNAIVTAIDEHIENGLQLVEYGKFRGWVELDYLEPYVEQLEKDCVDLADLQTPREDAEQYVNYDGRDIFNACGMISIAYLLKIPLVEVFDTWKEREAAHYGLIKRENYLTNADDLIVILSALGTTSERLRLRRYAPSLITGKEITAVTISKLTGRLSTSGVRHWVVPVAVFPDRVGYGTIDLYNPFPNRIERYSWNEFRQSAGIVSGVVVKDMK